MLHLTGIQSTMHCRHSAVRSRVSWHLARYYKVLPFSLDPSLFSDSVPVTGHGVGKADASATYAIFLTVVQDIFSRLTSQHGIPILLRCSDFVRPHSNRIGILPWDITLPGSEDVAPRCRHIQRRLDRLRHPLPALGLS